MTRLNALEGKNLKINQNIVTDEKSWKIGKSSQKIDPKDVMDLSIFKIGGWNELQPIGRNSLGKFIDENWPWLLVGIPSRDPFLVTHYLEKRSESSDQHMKKLMSLPEGLRVMIQCNERQHSADFYRLHEHPGGPASWREPMMRKLAKESSTYCVRGPVCKWNLHKMQTESNECVRETTSFITNSWRIKTALESYFESW